MAGWRDLEARVDAAMTRAWSENVRISFMKNGTLDPARPLIDTVAILHTGGDDSYAAGSGTRVRLSAGRPSW